MRRALPAVLCPILTNAAFSAPLTVNYHADTIRPETWTIIAKKLAGGVLILGFSALDEIHAPEEKLASNLDLFGDTVEKAVRVNPSKLDNALNGVVLSDAGELLDAFGRLPLKTDAMLVGQMSNSEREIPFGEKLFLVASAPLLDVDAKPAGTIIQFKDITQERRALNSEVKFNIGISAASFGVFLVLAAFYSARQEREK